MIKGALKCFCGLFITVSSTVGLYYPQPRMIGVNPVRNVSPYLPYGNGFYGGPDRSATPRLTNAFSHHGGFSPGKTKEEMEFEEQIKNYEMGKQKMPKFLDNEEDDEDDGSFNFDDDDDEDESKKEEGEEEGEEENNEGDNEAPGPSQKTENSPGETKSPPFAQAPIQQTPSDSQRYYSSSGFPNWTVMQRMYQASLANRGQPIGRYSPFYQDDYAVTEVITGDRKPPPRPTNPPFGPPTLGVFPQPCLPNLGYQVVRKRPVKMMAPGYGRNRPPIRIIIPKRGPHSKYQPPLRKVKLRKPFGTSGVEVKQIHHHHIHGDMQQPLPEAEFPAFYLNKFSRKSDSGVRRPVAVTHMTVRPNPQAPMPWLYDDM